MADRDSHPSTVPLPFEAPFALPEGDHEPSFTTLAHLTRFARCPLSFRLHHRDKLPAELAPERQLGAVLQQALAASVRDHVAARRSGPLDREVAVEAFHQAWLASELRDHELFAEGLDLLTRWLAREGDVDAARVLAVEHPFTLPIGAIAVRGVMDRVDRTGRDTVRVRAYTSTRVPPSREDVDESLPLALCDLAARQLWPCARRVEVALDLLRYDVVVAIERTDAQREATREYVRATVARIRARDDRPRPSIACAHCDHRGQCPAWADARAGRRVHTGAPADDLPAVAREREELATLLRALGERKDALDDVLRAALEHAPELHLEGHRYRLNVAMRRDYPLEPTLAALENAGVPREQALAKLGAIDASALKALLAALRGGRSPEDLAALQARLDAQARCSPVTRLTVREVRS